MKDFVFLENEDLIPLSDDISIVQKACSEEVFIGNSKLLNPEVYAPEINFYLKNSQDDVLKKAKTIESLYKIRSKVYDLGLDLEYTKEVGKNVIIVSNEDQNELIESLKKQEYKVLKLSNEQCLGVLGCVGELCVIALKDNEQVEIDCDFFLYDVKKESFDQQSGCYDLTTLSQEELIKLLNSNSPKYKFRNYISYDDSICQYHERRSIHCGKCAEICPSVAILKDDEQRKLEFSHVDCLSCGDCVGICPSGALDYAPMPRNSFYEILKFYEDKIILIIPEKMSIENLNITLKEDVMPFMIKGENYLDQAHFLAMLQTSGASVIFYSDGLSQGALEVIALMNEIFQRKFKQNAIFLAKDKKELLKAINQAHFIENLKFISYNPVLLKREDFAIRLRELIKEENLGNIPSKEWIRYGKITINADTCTLCLSCVGACNVGALVADTKDNSLKFNASLCTTCGYCEASCAEKDTLMLQRSGIDLEKEYFSFMVLAQDELFACVECGKEFATKKAIEKIASIMKPRFMGDEAKIKTLYCCAECKAKVMIQSMNVL
ncbi:TPA: 4Fe-4S dicluster domain-containing protein [Campylobacter lari]|nr:4Fe-4S dicluster domain-containing protein [Campylobacter lari]